MMRRIKRAFLDYASTTPVDKRVLKSMMPYFSKNFGNASTYYQEGLVANNALEEARKNIAQVLGVKNHEIIFTASGTESNNLLIKGLLHGIKDESNIAFQDWINKTFEIITTEIEHPSIIEQLHEIDQKDATVKYLQVSEKGLINLADLEKLLNEDTLLISVILVNNEIGTVQPIREISSMVKKFKNKIGRRFDEPPFIHTDASQAPYYYDLKIDKLGIHALTIDGSKIYGPKGVSCIIKKAYVPLRPIIQGGGQEFGLRPGTENVPLIVGLSKALEIAQKNHKLNFDKAKKLQDYFIKEISLKIPTAKVNGSLKKRSPNNVNICIKNLNSEFAVIQLDELGVACSATTACKGNSSDPRSYVVDAIYKSTELDCGKSSLRFTFGKDTKKSDIDFAIKCLSGII